MLVRPGSLRAVARIGLAAAFTALIASSSTSARAGEKEDTATVNAVDKILSTEVASANFGEARKQLKRLLDKCKKGCSGPAVARVYVALGMVSAQINQSEEAKTAWFDAFSVDSTAALPSAGVSQSVRQQFEDVKKQWLAANPQPDDAAKGGWINKQAYELAKQGVQAEQAQNYSECIDKDKAALTLEENMRARMHLASCEEKSGKIVDALRNNAKALELARSKSDAVTAKVIAERAATLLPKLAHMKFERPVEVTDLQVTFDDRPVPEARLAESFTIDPGSHSVHAEGLLRGARVSSDDKFEVKEGETAIVKIKLKPVALTKGQLECMVSAKSQEEILACLPSEGKPLQVHAALEMSGYTDTTAVHILTPALNASVASPTAGWNIGASYLIDVVTAASPDVVSTASRSFHDIRHAATGTGGWKPGNFGGQIFGAYSTEHDYTSRTLGIAGSGDFYEKQISPTVGFSYTWDTVGRTGTDFDVFSHSFKTYEFTAGSTFVLSPISVFVLGAGIALETGDQSKPYRYIAMFDAGVNPPSGASIEDVNTLRLPIKPLEQLPLDRQRFSVSGRFVSRLRSNTTLRLEERLYRDSWGLLASTTDFRYLIDMSPRLRVWPHAHGHVQSQVKFYRRVYGATLNSDGSATIPQYRTSDRELSPMFGVTLGAGARYALLEPGGKVQLGLYASGDALYNHYFDSFFITQRLAGYGTVGIEGDFE